MSEIKVNSIKGVSATSAAISINNTDGTCTANITSVNGGQFSNRNVIINGACEVAQRSNLLTSQSGYGAVDRFKLESGGASRFTLSKSDGVGAQYGLPSSLKFETTTADSSVAATDYMYIVTKLEGQDMQRFQKGTSDAKQFTLQFWIKLAVAGTYVVQLFDADNSRHVVANYTVSSANTWEKKIITFPADTTGTFDNDNARSLDVRWQFLGGSNYRGGTQQTTWGAIVGANMLEGMGNAVSSTGDNFITGMQLEVGSVATDFEHRSFAQELDLCARYCQVLIQGQQYLGTCMLYTSSIHTAALLWKKTMRATPTIVANSGGDYYITYRNNGQSTYTSLDGSLSLANQNGGGVFTTGGSGTQGHAGTMGGANASTRVYIQAEL